MFVVVAYDVVEDRRRNKIAGVLLNFGRRVQKSVFEAIVDDKQFVKMKAALEKHIDMETDSVRYYFLCQRCVPATVVSGWGTVSEDEGDAVIIV